ncbi:conserved hypothetical protein [Talaromyces stipitatus ATCC 10500]|uniref:Uncharacterized protein n=1 Tax=Talaromyces stipitatus (strain ATCC 10500 / CBS 375.48 / QM 6759 / NRRL 1006) TaxID=441959 RepID=B8LSV7_TALSN|nr:uncharacterized protein TSTA_064220 [Talaromyces stipitatus ATCC 10500]EED22953.1 conserved hypothetical protein [Talaromyces stipitatus ATCC 10500]
MSSQDRLGDVAVEVNVPRVKKRSTAASSSQNGQQSQAFFFVDPASSTREKRAHVMRHHIQTKRKQNMLANHADRHSRREPRVYPWMKKSSDNGGANAGSKPLRGVVPMKSTVYKPDESSNAVVHHLNSLAALRKDPFATLAFDTSVPWAEEHLVDMWTSRLTYWSGQNIHMKNRIFQEAMRNRTTFEAVVLGYCARWESTLTPPDPDGSKDSSRVQFYESRVRQAIASKQAYRSSPVFDEQALSLTLTGLALQEERFGDKDKAREYAEQAKALQLYRHSQSVNAANSVRPFLLYVLGTMDPCSLTVEMDEIAHLVDFLHMAHRSLAADNDENYLIEVPQRSAAFQFDSPLFQLLSAGPRPSQVPIENRSFVVNKNKPTTEWARTAALIYIVMALSEFGQEKSKVVRFLDHLLQLVADYGLDRNPACESFMYFLMEETFDSDLRQPDRVWRANDLLQIQKRLPFESQFRFNEMLLGYLMLMPPVTTVEAFEKDLLDTKIR